MKEAGVEPEIDQAALSKGILILDFEWSVEGSKITLRAKYPDSFPRLRPEVRLLGNENSFPARHCSPVNGVLCLLGRDSRQWVPSWTLGKLLEKQLANALNDDGDVEIQAEPAEYWWNNFGVEDAYCLIDSTWDLGEATFGTLKVQYKIINRKALIIRSVVREVLDNQKNRIGEWTSALPEELRDTPNNEITIPWVLVENTLLPTGEEEQIFELWSKYKQLSNSRFLKLSPSLHAYMFALVYPSELSPGKIGLGWLFPFIHGSKRVLRSIKADPGGPTYTFIRAYRAGSEDLGVRAPAVTCLREKKIAVFGLGAVGAPLATELSRNRCARLHMIEHDIVEPGNSIRWPLGASAWGRRKLAALHSFISREYPETELVLHNHNIGIPPEKNEDALQDDRLISTVLDDVHLVVDATASYGVVGLLGDYCRERKLPLISLYASPTVEGGVVARFAPDDGCPTCLEFAWDDGSIFKPPGLGNEETLIQPKGCAEMTFAGANYDLQELSLQAVRLIVETLNNTGGQISSTIETLSLVDDTGSPTPPTWKVDMLPVKPGCTCQRT